MSVKHEEDDEEEFEEPYVMNYDIHQENPEGDTTLQQMNTIITDSAEVVDESGWSQTNNSLQKPCLYEKSLVDGPEVKEEDVDDSSVHHPVDESPTTNTKVNTTLFFTIPTYL